MLLKLIDSIKKTKNLKFPQKGIVVSNNDPKKLGRVKATVKGVYEETDINKLPWILPKMSAGLGGGNTSSSFFVPEVGNELIIEFPYDDVYFPVFTGYWESSVVHKTLFDENYPETYGFQDSTGNHIKINKTLKTAEIKHSSGVTITIDQNGKLVINTQENQEINIINDKIETVGNNVVVNVQGTSAVTVIGDKIEESLSKNTIKGATVDLDDGTGATIPLNNFSQCPILGIPHGLNLNVKCPQ